MANFSKSIEPISFAYAVDDAPADMSRVPTMTQYYLEGPHGAGNNTKGARVLISLLHMNSIHTLAKDCYDNL